MKNKYKSIRYADRTRFKTNLPFQELIKSISYHDNKLDIIYDLDLDYKVGKIFDDFKKKDFYIGSIDSFGNIHGKMTGKMIKIEEFQLQEYKRNDKDNANMICKIILKVKNVKLIPNETNISFMKKPMCSAK